MKTDIEIARETKLNKIEDVAEKLGVPRDEVQNYGRYIANGGRATRTAANSRRRAEKTGGRADVAAARGREETGRNMAVNVCPESTVSGRRA
jgi:hypothetical protein